MRRYERGQYIYELVNEGAGMCGLRIGVVMQAGPRQYAVCWEHGHRNRYAQGHYGHKIMDWTDWSADERRKVQDRIFQHCGI